MDVLVGEDVYEQRFVTVGLSDVMTEILKGVTEEDAIKVWNQPRYEGFPEARLFTGLPATEAKAFARKPPRIRSGCWT